MEKFCICIGTQNDFKSGSCQEKSVCCDSNKRNSSRGSSKTRGGCCIPVVCCEKQKKNRRGSCDKVAPREKVYECYAEDIQEESVGGCGCKIDGSLQRMVYELKPVCPPSSCNKKERPKKMKVVCNCDCCIQEADEDENDGCCPNDNMNTGESDECVCILAVKRNKNKGCGGNTNKYNIVPFRMCD